MASDQHFVDFVMDQISYPGEIHYKKMFGEYGLYADEKIFALVCDNKLFIKPTQEGKEFIGDEAVEAPPYTGAKNSLLIEDKLEDREWLSELIQITAAALPMPKPKKKKKS